MSVVAVVIMAAMAVWLGRLGWLMGFYPFWAYGAGVGALVVGLVVWALVEIQHTLYPPAPRG